MQILLDIATLAYYRKFHDTNEVEPSQAKPHWERGLILSVTLYQAVLIHTASGLIGALSMLPGGIGGMEAAAISLSLVYGATQAQAVAATFLIRLLTLWFAVGIVCWPCF